MPELRPQLFISQASHVLTYSLLTLSTSIFIYITLYNIYVPIVQHTRPLHFQFDSTCRSNCSPPYAIVKFHDARSPIHLTRGQSYKFVIKLDLPESDVNWAQGVFMVKMQLQSHGLTIYESSRPAILQYKTYLTRILQALVYSPFHLTSYRNEMQSLSVPILEEYIEGARYHFKDVDRAVVELIARDLQVYAAHLNIFADLSGLSWQMYNWPLVSCIVGVLTVSLFILLLSFRD